LIPLTRFMITFNNINRFRFNRKAGMRETWLSENQRLVSQDNFGFDLTAVEAAAKKHEAIETDIFAYEERVQAVVAVAHELEAENYHEIEKINLRKDNVLRLWNYLLELLKARCYRIFSFKSQTFVLTINFVIGAPGLNCHCSCSIVFRK